MNKKDFIDKHILPMESKETIIGYLQGEVDFDENYLQEVANEHEVIINEATPTWIGVEIPTNFGYYRICIGLKEDDHNEVSFCNETDIEYHQRDPKNIPSPWNNDGNLVVRYGEDARVFDDNHELIKK